MSLTSYRTAPPRVNERSYNRFQGVCQRLIKSPKPNGAPDVGVGAPQAKIMNRFLNAPYFVLWPIRFEDLAATYSPTP